MNSIEFRSSENRNYCRVSYNNQNYVVRDQELLDDLLKVLLRNGVSFEKQSKDGFEIIKFSDVDKKLNEVFLKNRNIKRRVTRKNKFLVPVVAVASSALVMAMFLNSVKKTNDILDKNSINTDFYPLPTTSFNEIVTLESVKDEFMTLGSNESVNNDNIAFLVGRDLDEESWNTLNFEYEDRSGSLRAEITRACYWDVIAKYANMYGLPPALMVAVATQENTIHSDVVNSNGSVGLMQIQVEGGWNWIGNEISAFNYETGEMETLVVGQRADGVIDKSIVGDLEYNIKVACMIMGYDLKFCNYDLGAAIQTYNSGTKVSSLVKEYGNDWINHRDDLPGDTLYLEHVLSFIPPEESTLQFRTGDGFGVLQVNNALVDNSVNIR